MCVCVCVCVCVCQIDVQFFNFELAASLDLVSAPQLSNEVLYVEFVALAVHGCIHTKSRLQERELATEE